MSHCQGVPAIASLSLHGEPTAIVPRMMCGSVAICGNRRCDTARLARLQQTCAQHEGGVNMQNWSPLSDSAG